MFHTTTLATLSALALFGCIATPASAQHFHGGLADHPTHSHHHYGHGYEYHLDPYHDYRYRYGSDYGHGHVEYPATALSRHHPIPAYAGAMCPNGYGNSAICSEPIGCPLGHGRALPSRLTDDYQPGSGYEVPSHNHAHGDDSHSGHSHDGHSHEGHSHGQNSRPSPFYNAPSTPSDRSDVAPPSLPRGSTNNDPPQQDFRREQPRWDDSTRIDNPPPSTFGPSSVAPPNSGKPKRFDTPPPSTL